MNAPIEAEGPDDLNIIDPGSYASGFPHATFERLRRTDPVSWWDESDGGKGFWAVTRYEDLLGVSRNTAVFSSAQGITLEEMEPDDFLARRNMLEYDPPEHTRYRRLVSRPFSRREVMGYEAAIREIAREVVEEALPVVHRPPRRDGADREAAADADARKAARRARRGRAVARRARRCPARQL